MQPIIKKIGDNKETLGVTINQSPRPEWVAQQQSQVDITLAPFIEGKSLHFVQYDVQPEIQALECYNITLKQTNEVTKAFVAYQFGYEPIITIHLLAKDK